MTMDFLSILLEATLLSQLVLILLVFMSIISWTIIFMKFFALRSARLRTLNGLHDFEKAANLRDAVQAMGYDTHSPLYGITQKGVHEFNSSKDAHVSDEIIVQNVERTLHQGVITELTKLGTKMSFLATCANTAPFIGLFGTVWGILHSFGAIGMMKSASLATVAPGISEALIATAVGLFVAIPASMAYNFFTGMTGGIETLLSNFGTVFLNRVQRELATK